LATKLASRYTFTYRPKFNEFLCYDPEDGIDKNGATEFISQKVRKILGEVSTTHIVNEIVAYIRDVSLITEEEFNYPPELINLKNGVLNWKELRLLPHSPKYHFRTVLPFSYNVHARKSSFFKALEEITKDDLEKALKIMEVFAWMFVPGYPIQKAVAFFGPGNNGKSVILNFLIALLGKENTSSTPLQTICNNRFSVPGLRGKLANIAGDVSDATLYDTSIFKQLTGGDEVEGEIKGLQRRPKFTNSAKMLFAFNRLPNTWDQSRAYYRRFELIEFIQDFSQREDRNLIKKITREEDLQAVFNLIVEIFLPILSSRLEFLNQESTEETAKRYRLNSNPSLAFIEEMLEPNPDCEIEGRELYNSFMNWCKKNGISPVSSESFGRTLIKYSEMAIHHKQKQKDGVRSYYYSGIQIKELDPEIEKSAYVQDDGEKNLRTFTEALNYYLETYHQKQSAYGSYVFYTLGTCSREYNRRVQKTYATYAPNNFNTKNIQPSTEENIGPYVLKSQKDNLCTQEVSSSDINISEPVKSGINENKSDNKEAIPDLNQSYAIKESIIETAYRISNGKKGTWIDPIDILGNILYSRADITVSLEDLTEKILPSMAGEGLVLLSNGKIRLTEKKLKELKPKEPDNQGDSKETHYINLSMLEDRSFSATDGKDYTLHKGQTASIPEDTAKVLIERKWAIEVKGGVQP
jgi:P4 family phage/plasmid primase-like protien